MSAKREVVTVDPTLVVQLTAQLQSRDDSLREAIREEAHSTRREMRFLIGAVVGASVAGWWYLDGRVTDLFVALAKVATELELLRESIIPVQ